MLMSEFHPHFPITIIVVLDVALPNPFCSGSKTVVTTAVTAGYGEGAMMGATHAGVVHHVSVKLVINFRHRIFFS